jgi:hypothetical protein
MHITKTITLETAFLIQIGLLKAIILPHWVLIHQMKIHSPVLLCFKKKNVRAMAVTELQVQLNDLINRKKASLEMYNDICQLFNDYTSEVTV